MELQPKRPESAMSEDNRANRKDAEDGEPTLDKGKGCRVELHD